MIALRLSVLVAVACTTLSPRSFGFSEQLDNPAVKGPAAARLDRYGDPLPSAAVARLGTQRWSTGELLLAAALSPDGTVIAASGNRSVWLLDAKTGKQVRRLEQDTFGRSMVAFSPDGKKLVVGDGRRMVIWDAVTGNKDKELPFQAPIGQTSTFTFSADGQRVTAGPDTVAQRRGVMIWDLSTGTEIGPFPLAARLRGGAVLSPSGELLATWSADARSIVMLWDVATKKTVRELSVDNPSAAAFSPDSKTLAVTGMSTLSFFDVDTGRERLQLAGRRGMSYVAFSPDAKQVGTATSDGAVQLWNAADGTRLGAWELPNARPVFTSGGATLALAVLGMRVALWELPGGKPLGSMEGHQQRLASLVFSLDGKTLLSASQDGRVCQWERSSWHESRQTDIRDDETRRFGRQMNYSFALSPDGRHLAVSSSLSGSRLIDLTTGHAVSALTNARDVREAELLVSPDGTLLAVGERDSQSAIYSVASGKVVTRVKTSRKRFDRSGGLAFSRDAKLFAVLHTYPTAGSHVSELNIVHTADGTAACALIDAVRGLRGLDFSPDGRVIATGGDGAVELWDVRTGKPLRRFSTKRASVLCLAYAPDGRTIACGTSLGAGTAEPRYPVLILERATGGIRATLTGQRSPAEHLTFSPDGRLLASGGADGTILVWDHAGHLAAAHRPLPKNLDECWGDLASADAEQGYRAMQDLWSSPAQTVELLSRHLKPGTGPKVDAAGIAQWLRNLDDAQFAVRDKAGRALLQAGELALPALQQALREQPSVEKRRRIEAILDKLIRDTVAPDDLRALRAIEVLEGIGTAEARALVQRLVERTPALVSQHARAALARWPQ